MNYIRVDKVAETLNLSIRSIQLKCKKENIYKDGDGYRISEDVLKLWLLDLNPKRKERKRKRKERKTKITSNNVEATIQEWFTPKEHEYLEKLIKTDYPVLRERAKNYESQIRSLEDNLKLAQNRIDVLTSAMSEQNKTIQQSQTLKFLEKTKKEG